MAKLIFPKLSYTIMGILFQIHAKLGNQYQEKYYQRALESALKEHDIKYKKELKSDLFYNEVKIGKYFLDFLIEDKIILELKTKPFFTGQDIRQVLAYLKANNKRLGILANFRTGSLTYKRIINNHYTPFINNS